MNKQFSGSIDFCWHYLRPYKSKLILAFVALLFNTGAILGMGAALRFLVDEGLSKGNPSLLNQGLLIMVMVVALLSAASYVRFYFVFEVSERMIADMRRDIYKNLLEQDIAFYNARRTGDLISRITTDASLLQTILGSSVSVFARNLILCIGGILLLIHTSPKLTSIVILVLPFCIAPIVILGRKVRALSKETQTRLGETTAFADESIGAIRTIKALASEEYSYNGFNSRLLELRDASLSRIRGKAILISLVIFLIFCAITAVLWVGGHQMLDGEISAGDLSAFVFYSALVAGSIGALSEVYADAQRAAGAATRMHEILNLSPKITITEPPLPLPDISINPIVFENVTFTYPSGNALASLQNFSLTINAGEAIALVGASGSGKSTVFQLLLRFYDPINGEIKIGTTPISKLDPKLFRKEVGVVLQEPTMFSASIRENICLGFNATEEQLIAAATAAQAMPFIDKFANKFATEVGERGVRISGGERQRLAISRAIIRDPKILLLDEATSALDAENEHLIQQAIKDLMKGRTSLIIAHRLSTVRHCDRIVLMEEGKIAAIGTHNELIASNKTYQHFCELQFGVNSDYNL